MMRTLNALLVALLASFASIPLLSEAGDVPRKAYAAASLEAARFIDSEASSMVVPPGSEVEVVAEQGDKVRIRYQTSFGWVAADALTDQAPVAADSVKLDLNGAPSFR